MKLRTRLLVCVCALAACARAYPPDGGDPDRESPRVLNTTPEALAIVAPSTEDVVFRFDETIAERGFSEALVTVSPLDGALRVKRSGSEVRVGIDGGWRAGRVYRVVLLPGIQDRFSNPREDAVELVFSTGPPIQESAIAGIVMDRITGRAAQNAVVVATRRADSVSYMAVGDTGGFYSLRNIPLGVYDMRVWSDANRNRRRDATEAADSSGASVTDTATVVFRLLPRDSTAPRVESATPVDSMHVRVTVDDWIEATSSLATVGAVLHLLPDSTRYAGGIVMTSAAFERERRERAAVEDTSNANAARRLPARGGRAQAPPAGATHDIIVRTERALQPGEYVITIADLPNIQGVIGGGSAKFEVRAARPPTRPDTVQAPRRQPR